MSKPEQTGGAETSTAPDRQGLVLLALILVAAVANLNLAVANVALPDIGKDFDASPDRLDLVAVGYSLGLAASVLWLGALGDRYGRKMMLILGVGARRSRRACSPRGHRSIEVLFARPAPRRASPRAWRSRPRSRSSPRCGRGRRARGRSRCGRRLGGAISALGPLLAGALLEHFWWGSVFLVTLPARGGRAAPRRSARAEPRQRDDRPGRQPRRHPLRRCSSPAIVLAINFAPVPDEGTLAIGLGARSRSPRASRS